MRFMWRMLLLTLVLTAWGTPPAEAQVTKHISVGLAAGTGHMPLEKWESFAATLQSYQYESDDLGKYSEAWVRYRVSQRHSLRLGVEYIMVSALGTTLMIGGANDIIQVYSTTWDFTAVPISLAYELNVERGETAAAPFLGCGVGYYFSDVDATSKELGPRVFGDTSGSRSGNGLGMCVYAGLRAAVVKGGSLVTQLRYRYADGMVFTEKNGDGKVEFTGVDLTVGIEWSLQ